MGTVLSPTPGFWMFLGVLLAVPYLLVGRWLRPSASRAWWAGGLVVAALVYIGLALARSAPPLAVGFEVGGVAVYGALAALGLRRDVGWLAAGWLLHPVWDVGFHPGFALAPEAYVWACVGFNLAVGIELVVTRRRRRRAASLPSGDRPPGSES